MNSEEYRKLNKQESLNDKKLKIPPAFVADKWICNHKSAKKKEYLDGLNLAEIKYQNNKHEKKFNIKNFKAVDKMNKKDSTRNGSQGLSKIPEIKEKNFLSKVISSNISKIKLDLKSKNKQNILFTKLDKNDLKSFNKNTTYEITSNQNSQIIQDISVNDIESQECDILSNQIQTTNISNQIISPTNSVNNFNQHDNSSKTSISSDENVKEEIQQNLSNKIKFVSKSNSLTNINALNPNENKILLKSKSMECIDKINEKNNKNVNDDTEHSIIEIQHKLIQIESDLKEKENIKLASHEYIQTIIVKSIGNFEKNNLGQRLDPQTSCLANSIELLQDLNEELDLKKKKKGAYSPRDKEYESKQKIIDQKNHEEDNSNNYQQLIDLEDLNSESYWIISGKTRMGLQIERYI
jgi:hypothetical protein